MLCYRLPGQLTGTQSLHMVRQTHLIFMNYLAHILLSGENRRIQIGNFVGDAVKGSDYLHYPLDFQKGMLLHRKIDAFSDSHPLVHEAIDLGRPWFGRYTAVVMDILFDHLLAIGFRNYATVSLRWYAYGFYRALIGNYRYLPPRFQGFLWHFIGTNRLYRYRSPDGIRQSLEMMVRYRGMQIDPREAIRFLAFHRNELQSVFRNFFPQVQQMCRQTLSGKNPVDQGGGFSF